MATILHVAIQRFRGIAKLSWHPSPGINCLIGPGDTSKSTILDAIDFTLGQRRTSFSDADFHLLDATEPIVIEVTLGNLDPALLALESYGNYLRGYEPTTRKIEDEPGSDLETVLTVRLEVDSSLEPEWRLFSKRADAADLRGNLRVEHRKRMSPLRIGAVADYHLSWRAGSVFSHLGNSEVELADALAAAARVAREAFGNIANEATKSALAEVDAAARDLGIPVGKAAQALLDPASLTISGGAIALHDGDGTPLRSLGLGSARLLLAGLQRRAAASSGLTIVDEVEHGLEPHRIIRFLHALGSADKTPLGQVAMATHSPMVLRELNASQLGVVRIREDGHHVLPVEAGLQGVIREHPEAFLGRKVIVCEGLTEVGFVRGLDALRRSRKLPSIHATGTVLVDARGESKVYGKAAAFQSLEYPCLALRDDDVTPDPVALKAAEGAGVVTVTWSKKHAFEDQLFASAPASQLVPILDLAVASIGKDKVNSHIASAWGSKETIDALKANSAKLASPEGRNNLAKAAKGSEWFKRIDRAEELTHNIIVPTFKEWGKEFREPVEVLLAWVDA